MGFLMGAYGKLQAGKYYRNLQYQLTLVTQRHTRVTKQIARMEKMFETQERNLKTRLQGKMQEYIMQQTGGDRIYGSLMGANPAEANLNGQLSSKLNGQQLSSEDISIWNMANAQAQLMFSQSLNMWQNVFELKKEEQLEPLKDVESELSSRKDSLESQIQLAKQDYEAKKEEEKDGAQNLKPNYTGS